MEPFGDIHPTPKLNMLLAEDWQQRMRIAWLLAGSLIEQMVPILGLESLTKMLENYLEGGVFAKVRITADGKIDWRLGEQEIALVPSTQREALADSFFAALISTLFGRFTDLIGKNGAVKRTETIFRSLEREFGDLPTFVWLLKILPQGVLDEEKLALLSKEELENQVKTKTAELVKTTERLMKEIEEHKQTGKALRQSHNDLKDLQAQLIQSGKLSSIGELAAGVAHELNQPLMIIRSSVQIMLRHLQKNSFNAAQLPEDLTSIEKNTKRMMNIINHLQSFSRQANHKFGPVDANKVIQDSFMMIGEQLRLRNIKVKLKLSPDLPKVLGDTNPLGQVFLNLLTNARDAVESKFEALGTSTEGEKAIVITTLVSHRVKNSTENQVEILFQDNGGGISQDKLKKIFDPFYTTKEVGKGTGLGLSISYGIIKAHGGEIDVTQTSPEGTTFRIRIPIA